MKLFLDTNVLIDVVARREPFFRSSCRVLSLCTRGGHEGLVADFTFCTIAYVLRKETNVEEVRKPMQSLGQMLKVMPVGPLIIADAIANFTSDFEDEVQRLCAENNGADVIITRDKDGFANVSIPVMTPTEFLDWQEQAQ